MKVTLSGPQGCGKTRWAEVLRTMFQAADIAVEIEELQEIDEADWTSRLLAYGRATIQPFTIDGLMRAVELPGDITAREVAAVLASHGYSSQRVRPPYQTATVREWSRPVARPSR